MPRPNSIKNLHTHGFRKVYAYVWVNESDSFTVWLDTKDNRVWVRTNSTLCGTNHTVGDKHYTEQASAVQGAVRASVRLNKPGGVLS